MEIGLSLKNFEAAANVDDISVFAAAPWFSFYKSIFINLSWKNKSILEKVCVRLERLTQCAERFPGCG